MKDVSFLQSFTNHAILLPWFLARLLTIIMYELSLVQKILIWAIPVIFAITLHEVAHGWVANKLGDPTARLLGRLTINPIKHIDPMGTLLVPGLLLLIPHVNFIFGWAKPVPITYQNLRNPKRDMALVALAGPLSNFLMALFWASIVKIGMLAGSNGYATFGNNNAFTLAKLFIFMGSAGIIINLVLMVLNLIPLPPLDGSRIVTSFLSAKQAYYYNKLENIGFLILFVFLATGMLSIIIKPPIIALLNMITYLFDLDIMF